MARPLLAVLAAGWAAVLLAAPLLPAAPAALTYGVGALVCHQETGRSFHLAAAQLPVCARCLGLYAGLALGLAWRRRVPLPFEMRAALVLGAAPTVATVLAEWAGLWETSNVVRFAAGAPLGLVLGRVVAAATATLHYGRCQARPPLVFPPSRSS